MNQIRPIADKAVQQVGSYGETTAYTCGPTSAMDQTPHSARTTQGLPSDPEGRSQASAPLDLLAVQQGLDAISAAALLLDNRGAVVFANRAAGEMLKRSEAIALSPVGRLRFRDASAQRQLQILLAEAGSIDRNIGSRPTANLLVQREVGFPLVATVIRCDVQQAGGFGVGGGSDARLFILLRDPDHVLPSDSHQLVVLFGLSVAEANVVSRFAAGASPCEIAVERGVSPITVRNQLKSAQAKIGVSRQSELVSVVLRATHI